MTKEQFIDQYVATFLASYMAGRYYDDCMNGHPNEPYNHQPVEDAVFLANKAWEQYYKPWDIGVEAFRSGGGLASLLTAVARDSDLEEAQNGYLHAQKVSHEQSY